MPGLFRALQAEGLYAQLDETPAKKAAPPSRDPNVVSSQQEEDDIAKGERRPVPSLWTGYLPVIWHGGDRIAQSVERSSRNPRVAFSNLAVA